MHDAHANRRGIFLMIAGSAFFAANDACSKLALVHIPPTQILAVRGVLAAVLLCVLIAGRGELAHLRHIFDRHVLVRAVTEAVSAVLFVTAITTMSLGDAAAILQVVPVATMAAAVLFFGARIGWRRWLAVIAGFIGVALVMKPASGAFDPVALMPLGAAFLISFRDFVTGRIGGHVPTLVVTLSTALVGMLFGFAGSAVQPWQALNAYVVAMLALGCVMLVMGHMLTIAAFRGTDPALISPFRYTAVVCAVALSALLFNQVPDLLAIAGIALIVGAGIYTMHSHRRKAVNDAARDAPAN